MVNSILDSCLNLEIKIIKLFKFELSSSALKLNKFNYCILKFLILGIIFQTNILINLKIFIRILSKSFFLNLNLYYSLIWP